MLTEAKLKKALSKKTQDIRSIIEEMCSHHGVSYELVLSMVDVESAGNPYAVRYEPAYKYLLRPHIYAKALGISQDTEEQLQKMSWGLGQVMGGVAREHGFNLELVRLCDPRMGLEYMLRHLKKFQAKYTNENDVIAAYNAGSARVENGLYVNQSYVTKVTTKLTILRALN